MGELILNTEKLTKTFGKRKAVNEVSMKIEKGSIYGFIGRNGAGKTTFMKMISGLSAPTSGKVIVFGKLRDQMTAKEKMNIGTLIESPGLFPKMSAMSNMKMKAIAFGKNKKKYLQDLLKLVGLGNVGNKKVGQFSLGMRQRLGIALALVGDPEFLILDEPINGLDPQGIAEVREIIKKLVNEHGITVLISSHILGELSKLATHIGIINDGVLIEELTIEELEKKCGESLEIRVDDVNKASSVFDKLGIKEFEITDNHKISVKDSVERSAEINKALVNAGVSVMELVRKTQDLEEFYLSLTGGPENV